MAEAQLPASAIDGGTARDAAAEVLRRPEFAGNEPSFLDRIGEAISRFIGELLAGLTGTATGTLLGYVVLALLAAALAYVALRVVRGLRRDAAAGLATSADVGRGAPAWAGDAEAHEDAGRWRDAIRCRYRELVAALAARGVVEEVVGRTAGEYVAQVTAQTPSAATPFRAATGVFERAWYGDDEVDQADLVDLRAQAAEVLDARRGTTAVGA